MRLFDTRCSFSAVQDPPLPAPFPVLSPRPAVVLRRRDISDLPMWWVCNSGHQWLGTLHQGATRTAGCPTCTAALRLVGGSTPQPGDAFIA